MNVSEYIFSNSGFLDFEKEIIIQYLISENVISCYNNISYQIINKRNELINIKNLSIRDPLNTEQKLIGEIKQLKIYIDLIIDQSLVEILNWN